MTYGEWGCAGEWKHQDFRGFGEIAIIRTVEMAATAGNHGCIRERQGQGWTPAQHIKTLLPCIQRAEKAGGPGQTGRPVSRAFRQPR